MFKPTELLRSYIHGIRRLSGAVSATLFVPASATAFSNAILIHDGDLPPVPQLADLTTAEKFWRGTEPDDDGSERPTPADFSQRVVGNSPDCRIVRVPALQSLFFLNTLDPEGAEERARRRRKTDVDHRTPPFPAAWIGLRFDGEANSFPCETGPLELPPRPSSREDLRGWWAWLLAVGGSLAWHGQQGTEILDDPVTGLPGRAKLQATLRQTLERARTLGWPLTLLLINPDDFGQINERFGRDAGDEVLQSIAERLQAMHRSTDPVTKYGGAIFATVLVDTALTDAKNVADKVLRGLMEAAFLHGAVRLGFSIGMAGYDPSDDEIDAPLELIRRADQALNMAKRGGGSRIAVWEPGSEATEVGNLDRLSGIFTGNMAKDYRNMVLLWDAVRVIAATTDFEGLASQVIEKIYSSFKPQRVGIFQRADENKLSLVKGITRVAQETGPTLHRQTLELSDQQWVLVETADRELEPVEAALEIEEPSRDATTTVRACVIPLVARDESLGCLYLDGHADTFNCDSSDLILLQALASQVAVALDRAHLAELERVRQNQERVRLKTELDGLRHAVEQAKLVYRSAEEEALLAITRRVAPTDATVLITGESGTGKELLARTIHELSPRRRKPLVVVDCGTIPSTLIESELFGHEKGAYTGAQQRKVGRLAEADGGTVLLDEIGDLPLELQGRFLRFVQEKQFTPVGGTRTRSVDVRLIAVTNRNLAADAAAGRFRQDLYYRLNVVRLVVPPLRERPDDILCLANHFLERYSLVYQKDVRSLTSEAEDALLQHSWPGNVRELQNRIMQAVILCKDPELGVELLGLHDAGLQPAIEERENHDSTARVAEQPPPLTATPDSAFAERPFASSHPPAEPHSRERPAVSPQVLWQRLQEALGRQIHAAVGGNVRLPVPLGKWLGNDLLLEADNAALGVARRGAEIVGIPETTFRRRLRKATEEAKAGLFPRPSSWDEVRGVLAGLVQTIPDPDSNGANLLASSEKILLKEILSRLPHDARTGAVLLGVTQPTFHRRVARLSS